ncbi:phosphate acetyltransferase [Campylobacter blaseri]|uniref:Phosphate acetyltransferase n=2 Tax=Campylobacter blaseri TaxID=2042961 RepID=A0A2P8R2Q1_9BACT|nr:phosphate acetyltransferase [Campylobacter blaseri]PSM54442.1 phosphate acetyltransferase [Campylobacter blaseri]
MPIYSDRLNLKNLDILKILLQDSYKKIAFFAPIETGCSVNLNSCLSAEEFEEYILDENKKEIRKKIIKRYEELLELSDLVIVLGVKISYLDSFEINSTIAKDLNIPIIGDYQSSKLFKFHNIKCKKYSVENLGYISDDKIYFKNGDSFTLNGLNQNILIENLISYKNNITTPVKFEYDLFKKAKNNLKIVVLPEGNDERILKAADILLKSKAVKLIILGKEEDVAKKASDLKLDLSSAEIIDNEKNTLLDEFANIFYELRKHKGVDLQKAKDSVKNRNYFATMLVYTGKAEAVVSGADGTTADTIRPALQIIKTKPGISSVSGSFFICLDTKVYLFADCAIVQDPNIEQLVDSVIASIDTAKSFKMDPKVAMLSYSTLDSGFGKSVDLVKEATLLAKEKLPNELIDGPIQFDAAVDEVVASKKMPNSKVAGNANVFIFPDLNSGNIAYKAVQRTANAVAIGPLLQGLKKPINDLSRGCKVEDIVNTVLMSAIQARK